MHKAFCLVKKYIFILLFACVAYFSACSSSDDYLSTSGMIWNTTYHITFKGTPALADSVLVVLEDVGKSLNVFDSGSLVSRVNGADSMTVDKHFINVYHASQKIHKASDGMFDPTLSPLITAWGFGKGHKITADTASVDSIRQFVGLNKTSLQNDKLNKTDRRIQFNFSAVAKGYGCDQVAEMFKRNGVDDFMVEIGGEIAVGGNGPRKTGWRISIDKPIESDSISHESGAIISLTDCGIATSGNYRNFHKEGGKTMGHTISPLTGRPVTSDVVSATVVAPTAMEADAAATACMATGAAKAAQILENLNYEGMLILADSSVWMSDGFKKRLNAATSAPGRTNRN